MGERMRLLSRQRPDSADQGACADQGGQRIIDDWIEERTGKPMATVTIADIQTMPRQRKLRWGPIRSRLGGRLDGHLKHFEADEAAALMERGDRFLEETPPSRDRTSE